VALVSNNVLALRKRSSGAAVLHWAGGGTRRGLILLVVLVMIALLALLAASYAFMVQANMSTVMSNHHRFQARMAADAGIQRVIVMLRKNAEDPEYTDDLNRWFDNPKEFQGGLVYGTEGKDKLVERREEDTTYDPNASAAWRYNLVAPNYDEPGTVRYGITDECARLDLNQATPTQLRRLFETVIPEDQEREVDIDVLVDSLLDWRESGTTARAKGAKDQYYQALTPPYRCKGALFSTVEELLLVRGFTAWVLFGEDSNYNNLLDQNEDDADATFPPDNADGVLFAGVAPFLTVWSKEWNTSNNNRPRINLNLPDTQKLQESLEKDFDSNIVSYIMGVRGAGKTFNSVMNLYPAPPPPTTQPEDEAEPDQKSASSQPKGGKKPTTSQPKAGPSSSQPTTENAEGDGEGSTDEEQSENASEKPRTLQLPTYQNLTDEVPPGTPETLPLILDRLTVAPMPAFTGRINFSTAPREVLATIQELTEAEIDAIIAARRELTGVEKATPAWLVTKNVLDENKFRVLLDGKDMLDPRPGGIITSKSSVYRVESLGYADHVGVVERLSVVFEMRGPIAQVLYQRNLTGLGPAYNPHGIDRRTLMNQSMNQSK
jgi:type II secretory pathway component PulK